MIHYQIEFDDYRQHLIHVTVRFVAEPEQQLWLPTWIPGSYLIREFARHIEQVQAFDEAGRRLDIQKRDKNTWQLFNQDHELISIDYQVYAYDLSVRGSYVDQNRLYVNPSAVCLGLKGQEHKPYEVELFLPNELKHFTYAGALAAKSIVSGRFNFKAENYQQLIDSPFELAVQQRFDFLVNDIPHQWVVSGSQQSDLNRLKQDLIKICQAEIDLFGSAPFNNYTFMTMATANAYGGLEHCNSTSLICPRDDLPRLDEKERPREDYQRYLGLCSHEYFHSWLVKYIKPSNYVDLNLNGETYTKLLWVFEGFTSYYDDLILLRSGVVNRDEYLKLLTQQINRYLQTPGRKVQSVAESSFDTWIKFYRADENTNNAGISYYNKGALVALCLDLSLRSHGASLDQVMRELYQNAQQGIQVNDRTIGEICQKVTGQDWRERIDYLVNSTEELPMFELLQEFGIDVKHDKEKSLAFGAKVQQRPEGLVVLSVLRDSAAAKAGLSAKDMIVALNHCKVDEKIWQGYSKRADFQQAIACHVFRDDELLQLDLLPEHTALAEVKLSIVDEQKAQAWL
ncbi:M61 family metallopeptidase [Acinetobacter sp. c2-A9]|uniref:M61 family metallopeptidase n=1 Tax=Acinetobacter sp. c2-A9 TaxID=3342802 RepID=UPI0035B7038A